MAGIAVLSDLLKRNSGLYSSQSLYSYSTFAARVTVSASAAASIAASKPFAYRALFGDDGNSPHLAYCDAAAAITFSPEDYLHKSEKEYNIELKPLWYGFGLRQFAITSLRSFLFHYSPRKDGEEEDEDDIFLPDNREKKNVDLVTPFKKSVLQIICETSAVTIRRVLERVTVYHVSQRTAWKLLKDASKSAMGKAQRAIPTYVYVFRVGRTTFRTHVLVVASQWIIEVVTETCIFVRPPKTSDVDVDTIEQREQAKHLGKKIVGATIKGAASLIFATVGAAIFATLFQPSLGQWIGCVLGDLAGPSL
uniref:Uncharacterized protein n=1 Tax=Kalanchoe fedtschenkoi TaxID=63787 RepID=A0A7N0TY63_KALFE